MSSSGNSSTVSQSPTSPNKTFSGVGSISEIDSFIEQPEATSVNNTIAFSQMMQVPKNIRVTARDGNDSDDNNSNSNANQWSHRPYNGFIEKVDMKVPDRIIVAGQDKHLGAKTIPRELQLESVVLPPDSKMIRIQTPPRQIILGQNSPIRHTHHNHVIGIPHSEDDETLIVENNRARFVSDSNNLFESEDNSLVLRRTGNGYLDDERRHRTYPRRHSGGDDVMSEVDHLRNEMTRIKDRVVNLEKETVDLKEREQYVLIAGIVYIAYKAISWLCSNKHN